MAKQTPKPMQMEDMQSFHTGRFDPEAELRIWCCETCGYRTTEPLRRPDLPNNACPNCGGPSYAALFALKRWEGAA